MQHVLAHLFLSRINLVQRRLDTAREFNDCTCFQHEDVLLRALVTCTGRSRRCPSAQRQRGYAAGECDVPPLVGNRNWAMALARRLDAYASKVIRSIGVAEEE
jgi:hypothetical protein